MRCTQRHHIFDDIAFGGKGHTQTFVSFHIFDDIALGEKATPKPLFHSRNIPLLGLLPLPPAGAGWQLGCELTDVVVVLRNAAAVRAFAGSQLGLGGSVSIAAGPLGREAAAKLALGAAGSTAVCYSYSVSRGAYAGLALEGTLLRSRDAVNQAFYGRR